MGHVNIITTSLSSKITVFDISSSDSRMYSHVQRLWEREKEINFIIWYVRNALL